MTIEIVFYVVLIIMIGMLCYLFSLDKSVRELQKKNKLQDIKKEH